MNISLDYSTNERSTSIKCFDKSGRCLLSHSIISPLSFGDFAFLLCGFEFDELDTLEVALPSRLHPHCQSVQHRRSLHTHFIKSPQLPGPAPPLRRRQAQQETPLAQPLARSHPRRRAGQASGAQCRALCGGAGDGTTGQSEITKVFTARRRPLSRHTEMGGAGAGGA